MLEHRFVQPIQTTYGQSKRNQSWSIDIRKLVHVMFTLDILYLNVNKYKVDRMETHCIQHFNNTSNTRCNNFKGNPLIKYKKILIYEKEQNHMTHACLICITIYKLHGFIPNLCKIYYFICLYCLNMNVVHYLNMDIMCMTNLCKQHEQTYNNCVYSIGTYEK